MTHWDCMPRTNQCSLLHCSVSLSELYTPSSPVPGRPNLKKMHSLKMTRQSSGLMVPSSLLVPNNNASSVHVDNGAEVSYIAAQAEDHDVERGVS